MTNTTEKQIKRGDIFYADLSPIVGSEQGGVRPVVVISNNFGNLHSPTLIVAAATGQVEKPNLPTHILLRKNKHNLLRNDTIILLEQIRTIDRSRLGSYVGRMVDYELKKLDFALSISVGVNQIKQTKGEQYGTMYSL